MVCLVVHHSYSLWTLIVNCLTPPGVCVSSDDPQANVPSATLGAVLLPSYHPLPFTSLTTCSDTFFSPLVLFTDLSGKYDRREQLTHH